MHEEFFWVNFRPNQRTHTQNAYTTWKNVIVTVKRLRRLCHNFTESFLFIFWIEKFFFVPIASEKKTPLTMLLKSR